MTQGIRHLTLGLMLALPTIASAKEYQVPPSSTGPSAAYISDAAMERCIIVYNQMLDIERELSRASLTLDRYDAGAVNAYNQQVDQHRTMSRQFNRDCAGKSSESAYRAAQALNNGQRTQ